MMLARLRGAAIGGLAVLLLSGAGVAFAHTPSVARSPTLAIVQPTGAGAAGSNQQVDVQQGDQTAPDPVGTAAAEQTGAEAPESAAKTPASAEAPAAASESTGAETDGPGGHADAAGANVDHQFQGNE